MQHCFHILYTEITYIRLTGDEWDQTDLGTYFTYGEECICVLRNDAYTIEIDGIHSQESGIPEGEQRMMLWKKIFCIGFKKTLEEIIPAEIRSGENNKNAYGK